MNQLLPGLLNGMGGNRKQSVWYAVSLYGPTMSTDVLLEVLSGVLVTLTVLFKM